jgi:MarR-like DNA-binding transcriptional regulator SgrR of sgrS sRNA
MLAGANKADHVEMRTFVGSLNGTPSELDPARIINSAQWHTMLNLGVTLVTHDRYGNLVGEGARSWRVSDDQKEYVFDLARDVRASSGRGLDAEDWKATLLHILRSSGSTHSFVSEFLDESGVQTPSPYELHLKLKKPYRTLLQRLTTPEFILVPKDSISSKGEVNFRNSSGAYYVESISERPQRCVLRANHNFRRYSRVQPEEVVLEPWTASNLEAFRKIARGEWQFYLATVLPTDSNFTQILEMIESKKVLTELTEFSSVAMLIIRDSARMRHEEKMSFAKLLGQRAEREFNTKISKSTHQLYPEGFVGAISPVKEDGAFRRVVKSANDLGAHLPKKIIGYEAAVSRISGVAQWVRGVLRESGIEVEEHEATIANYVGKQDSIDHDYLAFTTGLNSKDPAGSLLYLISPKSGLVPDPDGELNRLLQSAVQLEGGARARALEELSERLILSGRIIPIMHYGTMLIHSPNVGADLPSQFDDELRLSELRWKE